jgi:hypothetical protein
LLLLLPGTLLLDLVSDTAMELFLSLAGQIQEGQTPGFDSMPEPAYSLSWEERVFVLYLLGCVSDRVDQVVECPDNSCGSRQRRDGLRRRIPAMVSAMLSQRRALWDYFCRTIKDQQSMEMTADARSVNGAAEFLRDLP